MPQVNFLDRLIPAYRQKALTRALQNETLLKNSGYFTKNEFDDFKDKMINAYRRVGRTSAPVMHTDEYGVQPFLDEGVYKNQGATGTSMGAVAPGSRAGYAKVTYGYPKLEDAEKYGAVPMDELSPEFNRTRKQEFSRMPEYQYGNFRMHLKPEVKSRVTIHPFDSYYQWPDAVSAYQPHASYFPVPYETENPEDYVGAMMDAPNPSLEQYWEALELPSEERARTLRERNLSTLHLLSGQDPSAYIEAHIHGPVTAQDVDFIERPKRKWDRHWVVLPDGISLSEREFIGRMADKYNIRLLDAEEYEPIPVEW